MKSQGRDPKATGKEYEDQLRASKGLGPNVERGPIIKDPEGNILGDEMTIGEEQETRLSRLNVLDFVSAPLSKPGTTLTQGLRAGAEAVKNQGQK